MKCRREGFALAIVLWIVAALLLGIAFLGSLSRDTLDLSQALQEKLEARQKARSILELLKYYILAGSYDNISLSAELNASGVKLPPRIVVDGRDYTLSDGSRFSIVDLSARIDLFRPDAELIGRLLAGKQKPVVRYTIRDSILDWVDRDNFVRLNGAEEAYYRLIEQVPYRPRNNLGIQSVDELRLVRGVDGIDERSWRDLRQYFYAKERGTLYNLALFDEPLLQALLGLNFLETATLKRLKEEDLQKYIRYLSSLKNFNEDLMGFYLSFAFRIRIVTQVGKARSRLETLIDFRGQKEKIVTYSYRIN